MRLSCDKHDRGYSSFAHLALPTLNGEIVRDCITADEERGECLCCKRGESGRLLMMNNEVLTEIRRGMVRITLPPGVPADYVDPDWIEPL